MAARARFAWAGVVLILAVVLSATVLSVPKSRVLTAEKLALIAGRQYGQCIYTLLGRNCQTPGSCVDKYPNCGGESGPCIDACVNDIGYQTCDTGYGTAYKNCTTYRDTTLCGKQNFFQHCTADPELGGCECTGNNFEGQDNCPVLRKSSITPC